MKQFLQACMAACFVVALVAPLPVAAAPSKHVLGSGRPGAIKNRYIVVLKEQAAHKQPTSKVVRSLSSEYSGKVRHVFSHTIHGYSTEMSAADARRLANDPAVQFVEQDAVARADGTQTGLNTWGIDRIDQRALPLDATYTYPTVSASSVRAYVIDSGIRTTHNEFGGRASDGWDFVDNDAVAQDCNGHGTHVAGTIGSISYGVAKDVNLIGVRVLDCNATGTYSNIIAGIDWVTANAVLPAVANVSIGGTLSQALDDAVEQSVASGVTYTVSAGNNNASACTKSPAHATHAITVAASDDTDTRWSSSNYGGCVDLFAPGYSIRSAYHTSNTATARMNGTSAAAPHVAGVAALILAANPSATPAQVTNVVIGNATAGALSDIGTNSPNLLLFQY
jgi:subtilisin family serine protease